MKVEVVITSTSVSWARELTPNMYVGGERRGQRGRGTRIKNDRIPMHYAFVSYKFRTITNKQEKKRRQVDKTNNLNINLMAPMICLEVVYSTFIHNSAIE